MGVWGANGFRRRGSISTPPWCCGPGWRLNEVPILGLVAGVAMAEAVETVAPGLPGLKWPNDLWLRGKKAGGIIAQLLSGTPPCVLLGVGLNLNLRPSRCRRNCVTSRPRC